MKPKGLCLALLASSKHHPQRTSNSDWIHLPGSGEVEKREGGPQGAGKTRVLCITQITSHPRHWKQIAAQGVGEGGGRQ